MQITDIQQQVKNQNRFSIYVDSKFAFALSGQKLLELKLSKGQDLDDQLYQTYMKEAQVDKAYNTSLRLLGYRNRSIWEVSNHLSHKGFSQPIIDEVIDNLVSKKLLDDYQFCEQWIDNRVRLKQPSIKQITMELKQKRVSPKLIDQVLGEKNIDEVGLIKQVINKKLARKNLDHNKTIQYLLRKGYNYSSIREALST